ncbi:hypothetical protein RCL1_004604 [Eukaryota sp. TZLM3-RCL]
MEFPPLRSTKSELKSKQDNIDAVLILQNQLLKSNISTKNSKVLCDNGVQTLPIEKLVRSEHESSILRGVVEHLRKSIGDLQKENSALLERNKILEDLVVNFT